MLPFILCYVSFASYQYAFQEDIVSDVLERLRDVGRREAELLFREHRNHPATPLPSISERISNAINSVTDAALKILDDASAEVNESCYDCGRASPYTGSKRGLDDSLLQLQCTGRVKS